MNTEDLDVEKLAWELFKGTGEIRYYLFFKAFQQNRELEITEPSLFKDDEEKTIGR